MLFLYKWKSKHNAAAAAQNINTAFENSSVNEPTIRGLYAKFETVDENLTNKDQDRPDTLVENEVLQAIVEKKIRQYCISYNNFTSSKIDWQS